MMDLSFLGRKKRTARNSICWIVGTSVSIEAGGYVSKLAERLASAGTQLRNLSVGDQTSIMGCMRVLDAEMQIEATDTVVWEYSLLDTLLVEEAYVPEEDVIRARRVAWQHILLRGARLIVLMTPPKKHLARRSPLESLCAADATELGLTVIDLRDLFRQLGIVETSAEYRDDRHPRIDSPVVERTVDSVLQAIDAPAAVRSNAIPAWAAAHALDAWKWHSAERLAESCGLPLAGFSNSLVSLRALSLDIDRPLHVDAASRIVAAGIVSTHDTGSLWCRHPRCASASTRLPADLDYAFLLRTTALPCLSPRISELGSAPDYAYFRGNWADYGQKLIDRPGPVFLSGLLTAA